MIKLFVFITSVAFAAGLNFIEASAKCKNDRHLVVAIDIGHSPQRFGALSARGGKEYDFNKRFAKEFVQVANASRRIRAFLISPQEPAISLRRRAWLGSRKGTDVFLSIHHDSAQRHLLNYWTVNGRRYLKSNKIKGFSLFVSRRNKKFSQSVKIVQEIGRQWLRAGHMPTLHHAAKIPGENRELLDKELGVYEAPFTVVARSRVPTVLVEVGVLINPLEEAWLNQKLTRNVLHKLLITALINSTCAA